MVPSPPFLDLFLGMLNSSLDLGVRGQATMESGSHCRIVFKKVLGAASPLRVEVAREIPKTNA